MLHFTYQSLITILLELDSKQSNQNRLEYYYREVQTNIELKN